MCEYKLYVPWNMKSISGGLTMVQESVMTWEVQGVEWDGYNAAWKGFKEGHGNSQELQCLGRCNVLP
jgi:hypothetical protein